MAPAHNLLSRWSRPCPTTRELGQSHCAPEQGSDAAGKPSCSCHVQTPAVHRNPESHRPCSQTQFVLLLLAINTSCVSTRTHACEHMHAHSTHMHTHCTHTLHTCTRTRTCMHPHIHTRAPTCAHMYAIMHMFALTNTNTHMCTCTHAHTTHEPKRAHVCAHTCTLTHAHVHPAHVHTAIHTCTYMHIPCMHTDMSTRTCIPLPQGPAQYCSPPQRRCGSTRPSKDTA